MSKKLLLIIAATVFGLSLCYAQTTVFSDDISANLSLIWTSSGQIGSSSFYVNRSGADWGARRSTLGRLELSNDISGAGNSGGWIYAYTPTSGFSLPYEQILSSNQGLVNWLFNIRINRPNLAGFSTNNYGLAFILGGTTNAPFNTGSGYALVLGNSLTPDPFRLAKYNNGLSGTLTDIITGWDDIGTNYYSIKITYNPTNDEWELFIRDDGTTGFSDPAQGTLISQGTVIDNTYTDAALDFTGGYWAGYTMANQIAYLDNIYIVIDPADPTLPVELSSFTASVIAQDYVLLNWTTQTETNLLGYYLYRGVGSELAGAEQIPALIGATNTSQLTDYSFADRDVNVGNTYYYWLQNVDLNGESDFHGPISVTLLDGNEITPNLTLETKLLAAYPNPFGHSVGTRFHYTLKGGGSVHIEVCNLKGQIVWSKSCTHSKAGDFSLFWDGKDFGGRQVSSGIYHYKMTCGKYQAGRKVVVLK